MKKLYKLEHPVEGIWYFTTLFRAAEYLHTCSGNLLRIIRGWSVKKNFKGWTIEEVDGDNVIYKFIDPQN